MAIPQLPPGFTLDSDADTPALPPGFVLDNQQRQSQPDNVAQSFGLAGRAITQAIPSAVLGLPALASDAYGSLVNATRMASNRALGTNIPLRPAFATSQAVADIGRGAADVMGFPKPQTKMQQGLTDIATAGLSAAGGAGLANMAAKGIGTVGGAVGSGSIRDAAYNMLQRVMGNLAEQPVLQVAGAVGGATATDLAKNANLSPAATMGLGIVGSMAPGSAATVGQRSANLGRALAAPFTKPGLEDIAGMTLNRMATNRNLAPMRMEAAQELVPGSQPTMAQVSRDPGLISAEKAIGQAFDPQGVLLQRRAEQNAARQAYMQNMLDEIGTPEGLKANLDRTIDEAMRPAFAGFSPGAYTEPIFNTIKKIAADPALGPRKPVQDALKFVTQRLNQKSVDITNPESLYAVRKDIAEAIKGTYDSQRPGLRLASGQLIEINKSIDNAIEAAAPGYRDYMDLYRSRAIPLRQREELDALRAGAQDIITDPITGVRILSPVKFRREFEKRIASGALADVKLDKRQMLMLHNIAEDLDRGAAIQSATIRSPGSDTMRNFSVANAIGRVIGSNFPDTPIGKSMQAIATPLRWLYQLPDEQIGQILLETTKDPKLAARLMKQASKYEVEFIANELAKRAAIQTTAQTIYGNQ